MADESTRAAFEGGQPFGVKLVVERSENGRNVGRVA